MSTNLRLLFAKAAAIATGRVAHRVRIAQQEGSLSWGIQNIAAGVYSVSVAENGQMMLSEQLIVQP